MSRTLPVLSLLAASLVLALPAAQAAEPAKTESAAVSHASFAQFSERFLDAFWKQNPEWAVGVGYYKYADQLPIPDAKTRAAQLQFIDTWLAKLKAIPAAGLNASDRTDYALIENQLEAGRWYLTTFKSYEWNPSDYNVADTFALLLNTDYAPKDERLRTISKRLAQVPAYYRAAVANITTPTLEHTELAIQQNQGALDVLGAGMDKALAESGLSGEEKTEFAARLDQARTAVKNYVAWLKTKAGELKKNGNARSFRIGKALYDAKFRYDIQSDMSAEQLYQRALVEKEKLLAHMDQLADELWSKYMGAAPKPTDRLDKIGRLIDTMSEHHVKREDFVAEIKRQIPVLEKWVSDHDLLELDPSRPLVVRETPEYMRGVAGASVSAPGPYDPKANTYYNVTPLDDYSPEQTESYLREYNDWILKVLNAHEAVPGHYVQLLHSNKSPSLIKSVFGNGAMIEGWAVYSERMMLESGYGGNTPEMWLMYSKWNLRVVCNAILDYSVHVLGMSEADALKLLTREAFQSEAEARGKWRRVSLTSVQLTSYFTGFAEIYDFREQLKREEGKNFDLKRFHEQLLSYGSAPVSMIKALMEKAH